MNREQFLALLARLRGDGDPLTGEEIRSLVAYVTENTGDAAALTDAELGEVEEACQALGEDDEVPLDTVRAAVELVDAVRTEADTRLTAAEEEASERETLRRQLAGETAEGDGGDGDAGTDGDGEGAEGDDGEGDGAGDGDAGGTGDGAGEGDAGGDGEGAGEGAGDGAGEPVGAGATAAGNRQRPARPAPGQLRNRRPGGEVRPRGAGQRAHNRIVRDGGGEFANLQELGDAMVARREAFLNAAPGVTDKVVIGQIVAEYPEERIMDPLNPALNQQRLDALAAAVQNVGQDEFDAATAAGGLCAPLTPFYGFQRLAEADRPFRAGLDGVQAQRGGFIWRTPPDFPSFADAVEVWTAANDADPGSDGPETKPCLVVPCSDTEEAVIYAVTECLTFGNFMARTDPETVRNATENTMAAFARKAEVKLLDLMKAASKAVPANAAPALGAFRDFVYHASVAAVAYRSRHRMRADAVLEIRMPSWVLDMARLDLMRSLPGDGTLAAADDLLRRALANARLVIRSLYIDSPSTGTSQVFGTQGVGQGLLDFPDEVQWQLGAPGSFFLMENGRLDLGVVRDSTLNQTNDYQTFAETFEGLMFRGLESLWITSKLCASGASSGTVDPSDFCSGQYVPDASGA